jgi:signal transduction histidine kinase
LSGEKVKTTLSGNDIYGYICNFYKDRFEKNGIMFTQSEAFKQISIFEQPSRIYPVFINLINNARYWVRQSDEELKKIHLDFVDGEIYVSDNGPGVDIDDIENLFTIFFTRKQRGGRGVGLYLCKTNLQSGGHKIRYEKNECKKLLKGANFILGLKGVQHG